MQELLTKNNVPNKREWRSFSIKELERLTEGDSLPISIELTQLDLHRIDLLLYSLEPYHLWKMTDTLEEGEQMRDSVEKLRAQLSVYLKPLD